MAAAVAAQRALTTHPWVDGAALRVRMGLVLYHHPQCKTWECRRCLGLTYPSQRAGRDVMLTCQLHIETLYRRFLP